MTHISGLLQVGTGVSGQFITTVTVQSLPQGRGVVDNAEPLVDAGSGGTTVQGAVGLGVSVVVLAVWVATYLVLAVVVVMVVLALALDLIVILSHFTVLVLTTQFGVLDTGVKVVDVTVAGTLQVGGGLHLQLEDVSDIGDTGSVSTTLHTGRSRGRSVVTGAMTSCHVVTTITAGAVGVFHGVVAFVFWRALDGGSLASGAVVGSHTHLIMMTFVDLVETGRQTMVMPVTVVAVNVCGVVGGVVVTGLGGPKSHKSEYNS